jgi:hypothetical protein
MRKGENFYPTGQIFAEERFRLLDYLNHTGHIRVAGAAARVGTKKRVETRSLWREFLNHGWRPGIEDRAGETQVCVSAEGVG